MTQGKWSRNNVLKCRTLKKFTSLFRFAYVENKVNEAAEKGRANFDVEQIADQLLERILDKRPLPLESDCLLDICIQEKYNVFLFTMIPLIPIT